MLDSGAAKATAPAIDIGRVRDMFDGNDTTLARSASVNPFVVTLELPNPVNVRDFRFVSRYGTNLWTVEGGADAASLANPQSAGYRLLVNQVITTEAIPATVLPGVGTGLRFLRLTVRRTVGDNYVHIHEWGIGVDGAALSMRMTFPLTQMFPTWRRTPDITLTHPAGPVALDPAQISLSVSDPSILVVEGSGVTARAPGTALLRARYQGLSAEVPVLVQRPVRPPIVNRPTGDLARANPRALHQIPIVFIRYFPTKDGVNIDTSYDAEFWWLGDRTLELMMQDQELFLRRFKSSAEEATRFRGYLNPDAPPAISYRVLAVIDVFEPLPPGRPDRRLDGSVAYFADAERIFERFNVRHYVEVLGARQVWISSGGANPEFPSYSPALMPPDRARSGWESDMAGPNGRVCNCGGPFGLPAYASTYTYYGINSRRMDGLGHTRGHQLESIFGFSNAREDRDQRMFWQKFSGRDVQGRWMQGRAGNTHYPPNAIADYNYDNKTLVLSDIEDWTPDNTGAKKMVNSDTWRNIPFKRFGPEQNGDGGINEQWFIYWMQSMPGWGNKIPGSATFPGTRMSNWWNIEANWDAARQLGLGLTRPVGDYRLNVTSANVAARGETVTVQVLEGAGPWIASSNATWIQVNGKPGNTVPGPITLTVLPNTSNLARETTVAIADSLFTVKQAGTGQPGIFPEGIGAATGSGFRAVAPGSIISIYGQGLTGQTASAPDMPLPRELAGVRVSVNGTAAPLFFVSPGQINIQLPWDTPLGTARLTVDSAAGSFPQDFEVASRSPSLFAKADGTASALNDDYTVNGPDNPARINSTIFLYGTGGGAVGGGVGSGEASPGREVLLVETPVSATIGYMEVPVLYAGLAPGFVGVNQFNLRVPPLSAGAHEVKVRVAGVASWPLRIYVR
jgi:uncharacterized protein (TIGR03437 family)